MMDGDSPSRPEGGEDASVASSAAGDNTSETLGYTSVTQTEAMSSSLTQPGTLTSPTGLKGALFAQWGRQKRRNALEQRYGEDFGLGSEGDDSDLLHF